MSEREGPEKTFVLIGHPVGHSLSPAIHHAAYRELGLVRHRYVVVDCPDENAVRAQFDALRRGDVAGANVTVPWKRLALSLADDVDASARATSAANVLRPVRGDGGVRVVAYNTDVPALAAELRRGHPHARSALVIGSGGAALAAVAACRELSIEKPLVTARKWKVPRGARWTGAAELEGMGGALLAWPGGEDGRAAFRRALAGVDLVIQSTSDGMLGASDGSSVRDVVPWDALQSSAFAYDVVYNPADTPFVLSARKRGLSAESGLGMLVGQAARAIELWLGKLPPEPPLKAAAETALREKNRA